MDLYRKTIWQLRELLDRGEIKPEEVLDSVLRRIEEVNGKINGYITVLEDYAKNQIEKGLPEGPLSGVPIAVKDNICIKDQLTTCASKILYNFRPPYNADVTERLLNAGAVICGKTNLDEFAMGSSTENSYFGPTRNPWNVECAPGGSSGGSAAVVSADACIAALGSDTGGSIRQPASFCGMVGMKPTYGAVSRYGLVAFASSLDQIGPMTKDVRDCAMLLNVISGYDRRDSTSLKFDRPDYTKALTGEIKGIRVGIPSEYFGEGLNQEVADAVKKGIEYLSSSGAEIIDISLPHTDYAVSCYYILATAEASSNLARYDGVKYGYRTEKSSNLIDMYFKTRGEGFGAEVKRRIMLGTYALSSGYYDAYYAKAQKVRTLIKEDFDKAFEKVDVIVTPTSPTTAFKIGEKADDPLQMYLSDIFTISVNLGGLPAISIPCGFDSKSLPIGFQIISKHFDESTLLRCAYFLEEKFAVKDKKPPL
ncbi:MAG: Asp-tRNA(Asn)/Glu-tRNA(Gln) amidotransferase subunit GatA [Candidatus Schekmanbacteria bacterium]|nr:MAG: Asp-tRNA(Asn)/Glu-tRNA(Gln) amidotransferase subunit GatA [Candidatus Schekmanbacteria bacterium]